MDKPRFEFTCCKCGAKDTVPFEPVNPKSLLCSTCHRKEGKPADAGFPMICCDCGAKGTVPFKPRRGSQYLSTRDVVKPLRVGHKWVARCQGIELDCSFHLTLVEQEQGHRRQGKRPRCRKACATKDGQRFDTIPSRPFWARHLAGDTGKCGEIVYHILSFELPVHNQALLQQLLGTGICSCDHSDTAQTLAAICYAVLGVCPMEKRQAISEVFSCLLVEAQVHQRGAQPEH